MLAAPFGLQNELASLSPQCGWATLIAQADARPLDRGFYVEARQAVIASEQIVEALEQHKKAASAC